jgi:hypothetical protein
MGRFVYLDGKFYVGRFAKKFLEHRDPTKGSWSIETRPRALRA